MIAVAVTDKLIVAAAVVVTVTRYRYRCCYH